MNAIFCAGQLLERVQRNVKREDHESDVHKMKKMTKSKINALSMQSERGEGRKDKQIEIETSIFLT